MRSKAFATALAASMLALGCARAADPGGPGRAEPEARRFQLGRLALVSLRDAVYVAPNDGQTFGVDAGPAAVSEVLKAAGLPTDRITLAVDALLIRTGNRVILLDTGLGPKVHGALIASLAKAGVAPGEITDVLITHSHGDHIGGLTTQSGALAFPAATIRLSVKEWAFLRGQAGAAALVKTLQPRVQTFEPGQPIAPGVTPIAIEGHTPGHVGYEIVSDGTRLLDIGDVAHSAVVSLARPDWRMGFDEDAAAGRTSRLATLRRLADSHELIFAAHFPFPGLGRIVHAGGGFAWAPAIS
jgi:glyoxylase-like metal-dependent hydrolase (beta-lactamase superfamily II)